MAGPLKSRRVVKLPRKSAKAPTVEVEFDYIKSNFFRVVRSDGAFGGLSPNGAIHMGIYSERHPFPQKVVHPIESGRLGGEIREKRVGRAAVVRELEVDVVMEIGQAIALRDWLNDKLKQYEEIVGPLPKPRPSTDLAAGNGK